MSKTIEKKFCCWPNLPSTVCATRVSIHIFSLPITSSLHSLIHWAFVILLALLKIKMNVLVFTRPLLIGWLKSVLRLKTPRQVIIIRIICQRSSSWVTKSSWYARILKLENSTKSLIISDFDHLLSLKLLKTKHIILISSNLRPSIFILSFTFPLLKLFNHHDNTINIFFRLLIYQQYFYRPK